MLEKHELDREWLISKSHCYIRETDVDLFLEKVARFEQENGMAEEDARNEAFRMLGAVYQ